MANTQQNHYQLQNSLTYYPTLKSSKVAIKDKIVIEDNTYHQSIEDIVHHMNCMHTSSTKDKDLLKVVQLQQIWIDMYCNKICLW